METALTITVYVGAVALPLVQYLNARHPGWGWRGFWPVIPITGLMGLACVMLGEPPLGAFFVLILGQILGLFAPQLSPEARRLAQEEHERDVAEFRERQSRARKFH